MFSIVAMKRRFSLLTLFVLWNGCGGASQNFHAPPVGDDDITLGVGDKFRVNIYGEKELPTLYQVGRDGTIEYPFIGRVKLAKLEPHQASKLIAEQLKSQGFFRNPQVSIYVEEYNSKRVTLMGAVSKPATYPISTGLTLIQAISLSGGMTSIASKNDVVLSRKVHGKLQRYRIPVDEITRGKASDFPLQAGDIVFVPERVF